MFEACVWVIEETHVQQSGSQISNIGVKCEQRVVDVVIFKCRVRIY